MGKGIIPVCKGCNKIPDAFSAGEIAQVHRRPWRHCHGGHILRGAKVHNSESFNRHNLIAGQFLHPLRQIACSYDFILSCKDLGLHRRPTISSCPVWTRMTMLPGGIAASAGRATPRRSRRPTSVRRTRLIRLSPDSHPASWQHPSSLASA